MDKDYLRKLSEYIVESEGILGLSERFSLKMFYQAVREKPEITGSLTGIVGRLQLALTSCQEESREAELLKKGISILEEVTKPQGQSR